MTNGINSVVRLESKSGAENRTVYQDIQIWLNGLGNNSKNTERNYRAHIRGFFKFMVGKDLNELEGKDLRFMGSDIQQYVNYLYQEKKSSASTIETKLRAVKSLFKYLKEKYSEINLDAFNSYVKIKGEPVHKGELSWEEIDEMILRVRKQYKGIQKALLIELAVKTSIRLSALLGLRWKDFEKINGVYKITVIDKGKRVCETAITKEFYDRLCCLKDRNKDSDDSSDSDDNRVFTLHQVTVYKMMRKLIEEMKLQGRNIGFHSFKGRGINDVALMTGGNIIQMQKQGHYASPNTTMKWYVKSEDDPSKYPCLWIGKELDLKVFDEMEKDDLIRLIKRADRGTQMKLLGLVGDKW